MNSKPRSKTGFTLIELMIVVAIMGVLAAIAVPSFNKTVRRSRTTEALTSLRYLYDGAVTYFEQDHTTATGGILPHQFPGTTQRTPVVVPRGQKAVPDPNDWSTPTWSALTFALADPHYYTYQFDSSGTSMESQFLASAFGDLDGDGTLSTFYRGGTIDSNAEVRGMAGVVRLNELE